MTAIMKIAILAAVLFASDTARASFDPALRSCHVTPVQSSDGAVELLMTFSDGTSLGSMKLSARSIKKIRSIVTGEAGFTLPADGSVSPVGRRLLLGRDEDSYLLEQLVPSGKGFSYRKVAFKTDFADYRRFKILSLETGELTENLSRNELTPTFECSFVDRVVAR